MDLGIVVFRKLKWRRLLKYAPCSSVKNLYKQCKECKTPTSIDMTPWTTGGIRAAHVESSGFTSSVFRPSLPWKHRPARLRRPLQALLQLLTIDRNAAELPRC